ncbi:MAG: hypothetical protein ACYDHY_18370 [Acidiferrobacterales bacterium]
MRSPQREIVRRARRTSARPGRRLGASGQEQPRVARPGADSDPILDTLPDIGLAHKNARVIYANTLINVLARAADMAEMKTPEQLLVFATIRQAVQDAFVGTATRACPLSAKRTALAFLTVRRFGGLCPLIGINTDYAVEQVEKLKDFLRNHTGPYAVGKRHARSLHQLRYAAR